MRTVFIRDGDEPSDLEVGASAIQKAQERGSVLSFDMSMSTLLFAIGSIERIKALDPEQQTRLRQATIRLSNAERKHSRESQ